MKTRLLIADDHSIVREGLRDMLKATNDLAVVAEAADGATALKLSRSIAADVIVLDIALPDIGGIRVLESMRAGGITTPVLFFSMHAANQYVDYVRRAGAQGFVGKDEPMPELLRAIRRVASGKSSFPKTGRAPHTADARDIFAVLSRRELEVMRGLIDGLRSTEIARNLGLSPESVATYRRRVLDKLGIGSTAALVALASRHGKL